MFEAFDEEGVTSVCPSSTEKTVYPISEIVFDNVEMDEESVAQLCKALPFMTMLAKISLRNTQIGPKGGQLLLHTLGISKDPRSTEWSTISGENKKEKKRNGIWGDEERIERREKGMETGMMMKEEEEEREVKDATGTMLERKEITGKMRKRKKQRMREKEEEEEERRRRKERDKVEDSRVFKGVEGNESEGEVEGEGEGECKGAVEDIINGAKRKF